MNITKTATTFALLFFATAFLVCAQAQKDEKGQPHEAQPQQHAQPAKAPAQQPPQHAQQAQPRAQQEKAPARPPQQRAQQAQPRAPQAKAPEAQTRQRSQQVKASALAPQQRAPEQRAPQTLQRSAASRQQPARSPQQAQSWQQNRGWAARKGSWQPHTTFQQGRDQNWAADHRSWAQRGGYGGSYIPQATFGLYFGSAHSFHIGVMPVMYMGYPRFAYDGFSFLLVDPWPGAWQENWYANDDVYIDFNDGYYLHDRRYPGVRLALSVAL